MESGRSSPWGLHISVRSGFESPAPLSPGASSAVLAEALKPRTGAEWAQQMSVPFYDGVDTPPYLSPRRMSTAMAMRPPPEQATLSEKGWDTRQPGSPRWACGTRRTAQGYTPRGDPFPVTLPSKLDWVAVAYKAHGFERPISVQRRL